MVGSVRGPGKWARLLVVAVLLAGPAWAAGMDEERLRAAAVAGDWKQIQAMGPGALDDEKPQVRQIALQALQILTGQTKGFQPVAPPEARRRAVEEWKHWLAEYRTNL